MSDLKQMAGYPDGADAESSRISTRVPLAPLPEDLIQATEEELNGLHAAMPCSPMVGMVLAPKAMPLRRTQTAPAALDDVRLQRGKVDRAIGKCHIGSLFTDEVEGGSSGSSSAWVEQKVTLLDRPEERAFVAQEVRKSSVCSLLEESQIDKIVDNMKYFTFTAGQALVRQGDAGKYFFILHTGLLTVLSNDGRTVKRTMRRGESSGEDALLFGVQQPATILAKVDSCVWALEGNTFRKVLSENTRQQHADNSRLLGCLNIFDGCSEQQKLDIGKKFDLFTEVVPEGTTVVEEGEVVSAIYFVREGELGVFAASSSGHRRKVKTLYAGETFCKDAALHSRPSRCTVMTEMPCKLVRIGIDQLRAELGPNLEVAIQTSILINRLDLSPFLSQFTSVQRRHIVDAMVITDYEPLERIEDQLEFVIVLKGSLRRKDDDEDDEDYLNAADVRETRELTTGHVAGDDLLRVSRASTIASIDASTIASINSGNDVSMGIQRTMSLTMDTLEALSDLAAGQNGARIATLTHTSLAAALEKAGIHSKTVGVIEHAKRMLLAKKIPLFLALSKEQVDVLIDSIVLVRLRQHEVVFEQGSSATDFWIIAQGEAEETRDGGLSRVFGKHSHFGVRAILRGTPRDSTVRVSSRKAEFWQLERSTFDGIITGKVREELTRRYELMATLAELQDLKHVCVIGTGGFGSVRHVEHIRYPQLQYALKRVRKNMGKEVMRHVAQECKIMAEMDHPLILLQVKTFETSASTYILTELLEGGELLNALNQIMRPLNRSEAQFYGGSLVLVLDALFDQRVIYRDLKPENVMLDSKGYIKLIDFGAAKKLSTTDSRTYTVIGSHHFMAPEVALATGYSFEADVWSLGVMIFEFVCGQLPFGHSLESPVEILKAVQKENLIFPRWYKDNTGRQLMRGMMRRDPSERLGYGIDGVVHLKEHDFFQLEAQTDYDLFHRILSRELDPPYVPNGDEYMQFPEAEHQLSDADVLGG